MVSDTIKFTGLEPYEAGRIPAPLQTSEKGVRKIEWAYDNMAPFHWPYRRNRRHPMSAGIACCSAILHRSRNPAS